MADFCLFLFLFIAVVFANWVASKILGIYAAVERLEEAVKKQNNS